MLKVQNKIRRFFSIYKRDFKKKIKNKIIYHKYYTNMDS